MLSRKNDDYFTAPYTMKVYFKDKPVSGYLGSTSYIYLKG